MLELFLERGWVGVFDAVVNYRQPYSRRQLRNLESHILDYLRLFLVMIMTLLKLVVQSNQAHIRRAFLFE